MRSGYAAVNTNDQMRAGRKPTICPAMGRFVVPVTHKFSKMIQKIKKLPRL